MVARLLFLKGIRMYPVSKKRKTALEVIIENALNYLRRRKYPPNTIRIYGGHYKYLLRFAQKNRQYRLAQNVLAKFIKSQMKNLKPSGQKLLKTSMRVLWEFHLTGTHSLRTTKPRVSLTPFFERELTNLDLYCHEELGWSQATCHRSSSEWRLFLEYIGKQRKLRNWNSLRSEDFSGYIQSNPQWARCTRKYRVGFLRKLVKIAFVRGRLRQPLHVHFPRVSTSGCDIPPSLWPRDDIKRTLAAINRSDGIGLRDYAILLLAARLGLRSVDIRLLRADAILWDERIIELAQHKTGRVIRLPLLPDVGDALADYLRNGRPISDAPEIFIKHKAPWGRLRTFGPIVRRTQLRAGITLIPRRGIHALRHTLATGLLNDGVQFSAISATLGHHDPLSTQRYLAVATELLRQAALEVEWKEGTNDR